MIAVFGIAKLNWGGLDMPETLSHASLEIEWPGLHGELTTTGGTPSSSAVYTLEVLGNPGGPC